METIYSNQAPEPVGPYSQAVRCGECLLLSGQIPLDPATGRIVDGGIREQTRKVLDNLKAVLEAAGLSLTQVVKTTVFMTDLGEFKDMNAVYAECFGQHKPARATVQVAALPMNARVEIEAIAMLEKP